MKLKLLLGALMFSAVAANAQLATINENFDGFTSGNATFPQNNWSAIIATNPQPYPPAPLMIVTTGTNKAVQSYAGNNGTAPSYLITPQIVAPTGDKTLSFTAGLVAPSPGAPSPGTSTIQIGLASNPADMTTFTAVGNPFSITATSNQSYSVNITASTSSYIVFKITPTAAHTATLIDDVVYEAPAVGTINENFNAFVPGAPTTSLPQNGWNKVIANSAINVYIAANNGSNTAQFYAANSPGTSSYLVAPKIVAPDGSKKLQFTIGASANSTGSSTIEAGMVTNLTDMTTFTSLGAPTTIAVGSSPQTFVLDVPTSTKQYIVWKFTGAATHSAAYVDNVVYDVLANLGTTNIKANTNIFQFVINANNEIQFVGKSNVKSVKVYSASGNLVAQGAVNNNRFDVSSLATGVYIFTSEDDNKTVSHSKFIKK
ncbi:T9SS type A sorting domain-containing protein [Chryseobacterium formosus]|uniref:T9SS type A sorting domain-containing protein n=1 Tax=Chryseobacterium formosus TaxID=1537363 RepID=A0ABT3XNR4_9FLAO|nr:T9SS type A sorting domain-containing protein [Chryseobacterium formosus]MCX8523777.1 T9SS type A sorting domain-containing protein [Chryseobacterium formosus]